MIYALNVFNLTAQGDAAYREYSLKAGKIIYGLGGKVISAGRDPIRELHGEVTRRCLIVVEFPDIEVFDAFIAEADRQGIHELREGSTCDYIWTLYEPWDLKAFVAGETGPH